MTDHEIIFAKLRAQQPQLAKLGVKHLFLFGSGARGQLNADSDIDLFFDYTDESALTLDNFILLRETLCNLTSRPVDITTRRGLKPVMRQAIEQNATQVF